MPAVVIAGERYLTVREAADFLEVDPSHVRYLARKGSLVADRASGVLLVTERSVHNYGATRGWWNPGQCRGGRAAQERKALAGAVVIRKGGNHGA